MIHAARQAQRNYGSWTRTQQISQVFLTPFSSQSFHLYCNQKKIYIPIKKEQIAKELWEITDCSYEFLNNNRRI